jgi:hypothetical protein
MISMTEWIDVLVYTTLMAILWFALPRANARFTLPVIASRNPDWLAAHPDAARRLTRGVWFQRLCYVLGTLSVALLVAAQAGIWPEALSAPAFERERWMVLSDLFTALMLLWLLYFGGSSAIFASWLKREVPLAERREASLEPRSIAAFVPRPLRLAIYSAVALHLSAWVVTGLLGAYSERDVLFWGGLLFQFGIALIFILIVRFIAERPPNVMDRIFGQEFRRTEVRLSFVAQLVPLMNGFARLQEVITGTVAPEIERASRLGLVLVMIVGVAIGLLRFVWFSRSDPDNGGSTREAHV